MYFLLGAICLGLVACQEQAEGCMDPRAINFDPEADVPSEAGCEYYQLELAWQHYAQNAPNDTLRFGNWLSDAAGEAFYLDKCNWLGSEVRLTPVGSSVGVVSPASVLVYKNDGSAVQAEDNFFLMTLDKFSADATGWVEVGEFDQLSFQIGTGPDLQTVNPGRTTEAQHPLSATASPYLYDSTQAAFKTLELVAIQPTNGNRQIKVDLFEHFNFSFPYRVTAVSGEGVPIRIRLDYDVLLNGISFSNDPVFVIENKLKQNIPLAFSVY